MFRIKRLNTFMLQTFIPILAMTFAICLFIFLMQFIWKYMDEIVGKGLDAAVLIELFTYAALGLVPQSLPIAVLLAALMTFGNLGESFELISMKAAGISLIKIMKPLIIFMLFVCIGVFLFQDYVIPVAQKRMYALLLSVKRKSPELEIPAGSFYSQIYGYNLYVKNKNPKTRLLNGIMIYDFSGGFENATIMVADSGYLKMAADKQHLLLQLYSGELFENLKKQRSARENVPYRRETFRSKEILIAFDANFNRMDESIMQDQYVSKNRKQLMETADSLRIRVDSLKQLEGKRLSETAYFYIPEKNSLNSSDLSKSNVLKMPFDSIYFSLSNKEQFNVLSSAVSLSEMTMNDLMSRNYTISEDDRTMRRHEIEWHRKYTLSVACLIFFFIGAPLGAIIRKGGLGMPVVISVLMFLFYHVIDNTNYKMARDGMIPVWQGIWLSSFVLTLLGSFFTYKAMNDSTLLNADTYMNILKKIFGKRLTLNHERKEIIMFETDYSTVKTQTEKLTNLSREYLKNTPFLNYIRFWKDRSRGLQIREIIAVEESIINELVNSRDVSMIRKMNQYPIIPPFRNCAPFNEEYLNILLGIAFPLGLAWYLQAFYYEKRTQKDLEKVIAVNEGIIEVIELMT